MHTKLVLTIDELSYIKNAHFISSELKNDLISRLIQNGDNFIITFTEEDDLDLELQDELADRLQTSGLDKDYRLNEEGEILYELVCKLSED